MYSVIVLTFLLLLLPLLGRPRPAKEQPPRPAQPLGWPAGWLAGSFISQKRSSSIVPPASFLPSVLNSPYVYKARTTDAQWSLVSLKSQTFWLGQTNWPDQFWGIWGIFGQTISTHFGTVSPLSMFSIIQPLFLQKTKSLYSHPKYLFGIGIQLWAAKN